MSGYILREECSRSCVLVEPHFLEHEYMLMELPFSSYAAIVGSGGYHLTVQQRTQLIDTLNINSCDKVESFD